MDSSRDFRNRVQPKCSSVCRRRPGTNPLVTYHVANQHQGLIIVQYVIHERTTVGVDILMNEELFNDCHGWVKALRLTIGQPAVCMTRPGSCLLLSTSHISFRPMPYVCGAQSFLKSNFLNNCLAKCPWQPSANIVHFACNSIPRANES